MAQRYNRLRDFTQLMRNLESFTAGQARIVSYEEDELDNIDVELRPTDGPYKGGTFFFRMELNEDFPEVAPEVTSLTPIFHPNIDDTGQVCLSLWDEWQPRFGLQDVIQGLLYLLHHPNLDDILTHYVDRETFTTDVQAAMNGTMDGEAGFDVSNAAYVDKYYTELAENRGLQAEAVSSPREVVPSQAALCRTAEEMLDFERELQYLEVIDNPPGPLQHGHYHSQQKQDLTKSDTFHGLLYHPGLTGSPVTCDPALSPVVHPPTLQRAQTVSLPDATSSTPSPQPLNFPECMDTS